MATEGSPCVGAILRGACPERSERARDDGGLARAYHRSNSNAALLDGVAAFGPYVSCDTLIAHRRL